MAIGLFMPFQLFSQITREEAFNIVKTQVFANDFSDYEITALPNVLQPYTSIKTTDSVVLSPNITSWFFCADNNPIGSIYQNSHCKFIFVDVLTGNAVIKNDCAMIIDTTLLFLKGVSDYDTNFIFNVPITHTQNPCVFKHNYGGFYKLKYC